jgi:hypothetical protein
MYWVLIGIAAAVLMPVWSYYVIRFATAAYFRSKEIYNKHLQQKGAVKHETKP